MFAHRPMVTIPPPLLAILRTARRVAVLTGAGISAESGVPTFREAQTGLWARYNPEELATPEAFQRNPKLVWDWYVWRRQLVSDAQPNAGHHALVELEQRTPTFTLITQNVDGLHRRAGSRQVLELHGNLFGTKCFAEEKRVDDWTETDQTPPRCPQCNAWLRPDVVWFGESLPVDTLRQAETATADCQVFFSIGTSALVYPAAGLPLLAQQCGATVVEINPQPTPLSEQADFLLQGPAGQVLPALVQQVFTA
ncbi:MAG: NAD-dependent deacylase [Candidatus Competibacteraceae bacterium]